MEITQEEGERAIRELAQKHSEAGIEISEDLKELTVRTEEENYYRVLTDALNIFDRIRPGCELSFVRFS
jgi:hypothetical protein